MSENENLKKQLKDIQNQLNQIRKEILETKIAVNDGIIKTLKGQIDNSQISTIRSRESDFILYWSIYISALVGVLGNYFVTLWFQPPTEANILSLIVSGFFLVLTFAFLLIQMIKSGRRIKAPTNIPS